MTIEAIRSSVKELCAEVEPSSDQLGFSMDIIRILRRGLEEFDSPLATKQALRDIHSDLRHLFEAANHD